MRPFLLAYLGNIIVYRLVVGYIEFHSTKLEIWKTLVSIKSVCSRLNVKLGAMVVRISTSRDGRLTHIGELVDHPSTHT